MLKYIIIATLFYCSNALAFRNEPEGFRSIMWADDITQNKDEMTLSQSSEQSSYYKRNGDSLEIGGAELSSIDYIYKNDKLSSIMIKTEGINNKSAIIEAFKTQFGKPYQGNRYIDEYIWRGSKTAIILSCKVISYKCSVLMNSIQIMNEEKENSKQKAE